MAEQVAPGLGVRIGNGHLPGYIVGQPPRRTAPFRTNQRNVISSRMIDPLAPTAGIAARLTLVAALLAILWLVVAWALA